MSRVVGIIAVKGGVGKTTTVANLAASLANDFNKKVLVVDANFSAPNLGLHIGVVNPRHTLHDVLAGHTEIEKAVYEHDYGFHLITSSLKSQNKKINPYRLKQAISRIKNDYDIILIDSSPTLNEEMLAAMLASDELLVVSTLDYPTLSCTLSAIKAAKQKKTPIAGLILNKVLKKDFEIPIERIESLIKVPIIAALPHDLKVLEALSNLMPSTLYHPKRDIAVNYKQLAASLINEKYQDPRLAARIKRLFSRNNEEKETAVIDETLKSMVKKNGQ